MRSLSQSLGFDAKSVLQALSPIIGEIAFPTNLFALNAIATAAKEQAIGLREINKAVNDLDRMTQENAAMSERTTDISRALAEGADALAALVSLFKVNRRTAPRGAETSVQPRHARGEGTPARRSFAA